MSWRPQLTIHWAKVPSSRKEIKRTISLKTSKTISLSKWKRFAREDKERVRIIWNQRHGKVFASDPSSIIINCAMSNRMHLKGKTQLSSWKGNRTQSWPSCSAAKRGTSSTWWCFRAPNHHSIRTRQTRRQPLARLSTLPKHSRIYTISSEE